jgi:translation initiation factor 4E
MDEQVDLSTIPIDPNGKEEVSDSDKPVTVFHDKDNFNVKHPLQSKWTLWFTKPPSGKVQQPTLELILRPEADHDAGRQLE